MWKPPSTACTLVDARRDHGLAHGVDDAAAAAGGEHHQALVLDQIAGGEFVLEIVREVLASVFRRRHLLRQAPKVKRPPIAGRFTRLPFDFVRVACSLAGNVPGRAKIIKYNINAVRKDSASISMTIKCNAWVDILNDHSTLPELALRRTSRAEFVHLA
jgi:hypothetical protein